MGKESQVVIVVAHYGLDRKITKEECYEVLDREITSELVFVDFEAGNARLGELYDLPFENLALTQQRKFNEILKPILDSYPNATIAYFGLTPIPIGFQLGTLVGNTHPYVIYQWHHSKKIWFKETDQPAENYLFNLKLSEFPNETQKGKGDVTIRLATSYTIDANATYEVVPNPANEFDLTLEQPDVDSLFNQQNIQDVVEAFQKILNCYANKLRDREKIHLFISSSAGLPFALGTRINPNVYPFIQTYQYSRDKSPRHREAVLISKELDGRPALSQEERVVSASRK